MENTRSNPKRRDVLMGTVRNALETATQALLEKTERAQMEVRRKRDEAEQKIRAKAQSMADQTLDRASLELKASGIELLSAQLRFLSPEDELSRAEDSFVQGQIGPEKRKVATLENALLKLQSAKTDSEATRIIEAVACKDCEEAKTLERRLKSRRSLSQPDSSVDLGGGFLLSPRWPMLVGLRSGADVIVLQSMPRFHRWPNWAPMPFFFEIPVALLSLKGIWSLLSPFLSDTGKDIFKERMKGLFAKRSSEELARNAVFGLLDSLERFRIALEEFTQWLTEKARAGSSSRQVNDQVKGFGQALEDVFLALDPEEARQRLKQQSMYKVYSITSKKTFTDLQTMLKDFDKGMAGIDRSIKNLGKGRLGIYDPDLLDILMRWQRMEILLLARLPKMSSREFKATQMEAEENLKVLTSAIDDFRKFIKVEIPFTKSF